MSTDAGYMLIRVDLQGAREAAAEATALKGSISGITPAVTSAGTSATRASRGTRLLTGAWTALGKAVKYGALGLAAGAAALGVLAAKGVSETKELGLAAAGFRRNLDLTAEQGSRWAALAKARGIDTKSLNMGLTTLSRSFAMGAKGEEAYLDKLKMIGLSQQDARKANQDMEWGIRRVAAAFGEAEGGATRQAAAQMLLGRGYQTLLPMFAGGSKELQRMLHWADKYNVTMGDEMVDKTIVLAQAERQSQLAFMGIKQALAEELMPTIIDAHRSFQDFAAVITDPELSREQKIDYVRTKLEKLSETIGDLVVDMIPHVVTQVGETAPRIAGALIKGILNANAWGAFIAGAWLLKKLGAGALLAMAAKGGGRLGLWAGRALATQLGLWLIGTGIADSVINFFAPAGKMVKRIGPRAKVAGRMLGSIAGKGMVLGLITFGLIQNWDDVEKWFTRRAKQFKRFGVDWGSALADGVKMGLKNLGLDTGFLDTDIGGGISLGDVLGDSLKQQLGLGGIDLPFATGGVIPGGYGGGDRIPIMGESGEFMLRKEVVREVGVGNLERLNKLGGEAFKRMRTGGAVDTAYKVPLSLPPPDPGESGTPFVIELDGKVLAQGVAKAGQKVKARK